MTDVEFKGWPKTPRLYSLKMVVTEKIDGTNSCVIVSDGKVVGAQSRTRLITPGDDNMGFARWVHKNSDELAGLGDGYHYGEWAGPGIQNNPHNLERKRFFLFDARRWSYELQPRCCDVVPLLHYGNFCLSVISDARRRLADRADREGYTPEGVVVHIPALECRLKFTFEHVEGKWGAAK